MNFVWKQVLIALAVLAALVVGGCGGDDESDGGDEPEAEALSVEEYTTETDEVLMTFGEESISLGTELQSAETAEEAQAGVGELDTVTQTAVDDLNAIEPPEEAAEGHESLVTARGLSRRHRNVGRGPLVRRSSGRPGSGPRFPGGRTDGDRRSPDSCGTAPGSRDRTARSRRGWLTVR